MPGEESWKRPSDSTCARSSRTPAGLRIEGLGICCAVRFGRYVRSIRWSGCGRRDSRPRRKPGGCGLICPGLLAAARVLEGAGAVVVRITALGQDGEVQEGADPSAPAMERYDLLGYDVADYDLLGGLTNCGYTPEEAASLAPVWAPRLNEWHLFDNPDHAETYADVTDKRVPEHAPFYAYGIYQLQ